MRCRTSTASASRGGSTGAGRKLRAALRDRPRRIPGPLRVLLVVALLHGLAWASLIAPLNGPDESDHAAYVVQMARTGDGPHADKGEGNRSTELDRVMTELNVGPMLGHADARPDVARIDSLLRELDGLPDAQRENGTGPNPVGKNPPLYYVYGAGAYHLVPGGSILDRLYAVRIATALLLPLTVWLAWLVAAELFAAVWLRTLFASVVALHPKLGFIAGVINADMLLITLSTATVLFGLRAVRRGPQPLTLIGLGLAAGGAALTHGRGLAMLPVALLAVALALLRARPALRGTVLRGGAWALAIAVPLVIAFLYTRAHSGGTGAFGGEVSQATGGGFSLREFLVNVWQFYLPRLDFMSERLGPPYGYRQVYIDTFFGSYGALEINFRPQTYGYLQLAAGTGLVVLFAAAVRRVDILARRWREALVVGAAFVFLIGLLHMSAYRDLNAGSQDPLITGRYLLPVVTAYAASIAFVARVLPRRIGETFAGVVVGGHALLTLGALGLALERLHA